MPSSERGVIISSGSNTLVPPERRVVGQSGAARATVVAALLWSTAAAAQTPATAPGANGFSWPEGARAAVSLTFDDARPSQVDVGLPIFDRHGVKVTFFLVPSNAEQRLAGWKQAAAAGHEIGNHSLDHPCTGNFVWARQKALEDYTLERMRQQLLDANARLRDLLGVTPEVFAYPCGQTFVGRGLDTRSYVPLVAATFLAGRGWLGEAPNDPERCDLAQVLGMEMDGKDFEQVRPLLEQARQGRSWLVLAGHDIGEPGVQTTPGGPWEKLPPHPRRSADGFRAGPVRA